MKPIILLVFVIYFTISLECIIAMAYKRFKAPERWHCMDANNRGILNTAMDIRMKNMPPSSQHRRLLKLFEECIKSGEGFRFKKSLPPAPAADPSDPSPPNLPSLSSSTYYYGTPTYNTNPYRYLSADY